jgi:hypothetical protein
MPPLASRKKHRPALSIGRALSVILALALCLSFLFQGQAVAQSSTVFGTITYRDGRPAVQILVVIGPNYRYTDVGGRFKIDGVPAGRQHMICKRGAAILWQGDVQIAGPQMMFNQRLP